MKILFVVPHADDEAACVGGTIAKLSKANQVDVAVCTVGYGDADIRLKELDNSAKILGCKYFVLDFQNESFLDTIPQDRLIHRFDSILRANYDQVYYPCPGQHHQDHRVLHEVCHAALRNTYCSLLAMYEYPFPGWMEFTQAFGKLYVDIGETIEAKIMAMASYKSQNIPTNNIHRLSSARGLESNCEYAEMFYIAREIR